jgi:hypothetical protein
VDVKIIRVKKLRNIVIGFCINQYRPYDGFLGFSAMWYDRGGWAGRGGGIIIPIRGSFREIICH